MPNPCDTELSSLPILTGCPLPNEYFLVGNAVGGQGIGLYGRRLWSDVRACVLAGLNFVFNQFVIGISGPTIIGGTTIVLAVANIIPGSLFITLGGPELPQNDNTQISYTVSYSQSQTTIIFDQAVQNNQLYILHYCYTN